MTREIKTAIVEDILTGIVCSRAWGREQLNDPRIAENAAQLEKALHIVSEYVPEAVLSELEDAITNYTGAYTMVGDGDYGAVNNLLGRTEGITRYAHHVPQNLTNYYAYLDYFAVSAETPEKYKAALDFIQPVIQKIGTMGLDREKVTYLNDYLKTLPAYKVGATAGIPQTFAPHAGELNTACGSYAWTMKFLCVAADIPCITISTDNHTWNLVYLEAAKARDLLPMFYLELVSGLRKGELVALRWDDVDIQNRTISVSKQYVRNPDGSLELTRPKTENSVRLVSIPQTAVELLIQEHNKHPDSPYLFPSPITGEMYHPDSVVNLHKKILKDAGLPHIRFHDLRHTFATTALQNGVDVKTVSSMLGHYDAGFTLRTYTHATRQKQDEAAATMGSFMAQIM